jgi:hypothetical protein
MKFHCLYWSVLNQLNKLVLPLLEKPLIFCGEYLNFRVVPRNAESQMAEEKSLKKRFLAFGRMSIGRMLKWHS